jgi:hypothetical protein
MTISLSNPRLSSFVIGELSEAEMKDFQALLDANTELQNEIKSIRITVEQIKTSMQNEPLPNNQNKRTIVVPKSKKSLPA